MALSTTNSDVVNLTDKKTITIVNNCCASLIFGLSNQKICDLESDASLFCDLQGTYILDQSGGSRLYVQDLRNRKTLFKMYIVTVKDVRDQTATIAVSEANVLTKLYLSNQTENSVTVLCEYGTHAILPHSYTIVRNFIAIYTHTNKLVHIVNNNIFLFSKTLDGMKFEGRKLSLDITSV